MTRRAKYTVTATRGDRYWVVTCVELPGAFTGVTRLGDADARIREAIAWSAGIPADSFDLDIRTVVNAVRSSDA